jgi:hypothetical protein
LDGDDVDTVWRMLSYLYTQDYSDDETVCEDNAGVSRASGTRDVEPVATEDPPSSAGEAPQAAVLVQDNPAPAEPCADADDIVNKYASSPPGIDEQRLIKEDCRTTPRFMPLQRNMESLS